MKQQERDEILTSLVAGQTLAQEQQILQSEAIKKISRGLYGDPDNDAPGLIKLQAGDKVKFDEMDEKVDSNTRFRRNTQKIFGGTSIITVGFGAVVAAFFDKIKVFLTHYFTQ